MEKFVSYEKLSKKKQRELNAAKRTTWAISPVTKKPENPKAYKRKKISERELDSRSDFLGNLFTFCLFCQKGDDLKRGHGERDG